MFHLIGAAHRVQSKPTGSEDSDGQKALRACLSDAIGQIVPAVVAEEFSNYALKKVSAHDRVKHESITKAVADSLKVTHRFCDPEPEDRKKMGYVEGSELFFSLVNANEEGASDEEIESRAFAIEVAKYWPLREKFWMDQLADFLDKDVIFVCGDAHVEGFGDLLKPNRIDSKVVARRIGVDQSDDAFWGRVKAYLEAHPDLRES
jgi:hypothetical protein